MRCRLAAATWFVTRRVALRFSVERVEPQEGLEEADGAGLRVIGRL